MKIIATISNTTDAVYHLGARMEHLSYILDIPDNIIPVKVKNFIETKKDDKTIDTISFSLLQENK